MFFCALLGFSAMSINVWHHYVCRQKVRVAAQHLAADLRKLQRETMYTVNMYNNELDVYSLGDKDNYILQKYPDRGRTKISFPKIGCDGVYFAKFIVAMQFHSSGAPRRVATYELRHRQLSDFACIVSVQPVTGRVVVSETI